MTSQSSGSVGSLFQTAQNEGVLSAAALKAINIDDIGADINAALGVSVDDITASEVVLVTQLIDDSGSIRFVAGNTEAVRDGHNLIIDALLKTKQKGGILVSTSLLNDGLLSPYATLDKAVRLSSSNYNPNLGTPLYARSIVTLGTVIAKCQEFLDNGIPCRTVTPIVTDGGDNDGMRGADKVKRIVDDMLRAENHIIAGVGIDDGQTDFNAVFSAMGILPQWILTPKNSPSEIRRAFAMLSQSAVRVSQAGGAAFSQTAMGGFGTP